MATHKFTTGYAYYTENGHNIGKIEVSIGDHPVSDKYVIVDVPNKAALDAIVLWQEPFDESKSIMARLAKLEAKVGV